MRAFGLIAAVLLIAFTSGGTPAVAAERWLPAKNIVPALPQGAESQSIALVNLVDRVDPERQWVTFEGAFCSEFGATKLTWRSDPLRPNGADMRRAFETEARKAGFTIAGADNLFETEQTAGDFSVAAAMKDVTLKLCTNGAESWGKGTMAIDIEWQVYSNIEKKVVATIATRGGGESNVTPQPDNVRDVTITAFAENVRGLMAAPAFRDVVLAKAGAPKTGAAASATPIAFTPPGKVASTPIGDAVGSVVMIRTTDGTGSGFLLSSEGYVLTNRHVVGSAKAVKVRWTDGRETDGEVLRSDAKRDVALIKTDDRGRQPLGIRTASMQLGEPVFAVGAPLGEEFQTSVTRGVVSANRIFEGLAFIQSDVSVTHGSSGGPLLDEKGAVVGLTVIGIEPNGAPVGINLFIPIRDALDFLGLSPAKPAATPG